jgi:peptide subunit release factor RF-3
LQEGDMPTGARLAFDMDSNPVVLFPSEWSLGYFSQNHPKLTLTSLAPPRLHTR